MITKYEFSYALDAMEEYVDLVHNFPFEQIRIDEASLFIQQQYKKMTKSQKLEAKDFLCGSLCQTPIRNLLKSGTICPYTRLFINPNAIQKKLYRKCLDVCFVLEK